MQVIDHRGTDPYFNLAAEEFLFRSFPATERVCMLWQNGPVVVIGKHQDVESEVNRPFAEANRIRVARRFSGGGAVYHDLGNLNLTFIGRLGEDSPEGFTLWLAGFLRGLGVPVSADARQALFAEGLKLSGSAQYVRRDRFLHHATLLFSTDLDRLRQVLDGPSPSSALSVSSPSSIFSPSRPRRWFTKSVKSPVANLADFLPLPCSLEAFRGRLLEAWVEKVRSQTSGRRLIVRTGFDSREVEAIKRLRNEKYANAAWIAPTYPL